MTEPTIRISLYRDDGRRRCVAFVPSAMRARGFVDEESARDDVYARVVWPDGRELELQRPAIGEPWMVSAKRMGRGASEESAPAGA